MSDLLGPNIDFHNGKARIKPPGYQSHQVWHQDWPYELHSSPDLAAAIFYLDDTDVGASATEVIPGSHKRGEWPHDAHNAIAEADVEAFGAPPVPLAVRAGSAAIIHVLVVHRATANMSDRNRSGHHQRVQDEGGPRPLGQQMRLRQSTVAPQRPTNLIHRR